jgi:predicted nucleic acid-binding protein
VSTVLDAGALIAFERGERTMVALVVRARERGRPLLVPAGVVAQVWRDGRRQARLATLLGSAPVEVVPLTDFAARAAGQLLGVAGAVDVVDASVAWLARDRGARVVTSDPDDLRHLDPELEIVAI